MEPFRHSFRVRYSEVDPQGVVFNSRYLEYADVLLTEFYRDRGAHGFPQDAEFHVRRAEVDYLAPLRSDELVTGELVIEAIGTTSMTKTVSLFGEDGSLRAAIRMVVVHVHLPSGRPEPVPDSVRRAFGFAPAGIAR